MSVELMEQIGENLIGLVTGVLNGLILGILAVIVTLLIYWFFGREERGI